MLKTFCLFLWFQRAAHPGQLTATGEQKFDAAAAADAVGDQNLGVVVLLLKSHGQLAQQPLTVAGSVNGDGFCYCSEWCTEQEEKAAEAEATKNKKYCLTQHLCPYCGGCATIIGFLVSTVKSVLPQPFTECCLTRATFSCDIVVAKFS